MTTEIQTSKQCGRCGERRLTTEFHRHRAKPSGLQAYCKSCMRARALTQGKHQRATGARRYYDLRRRGARVEGLPLSEFVPSPTQRCEVCNTDTAAGKGGFHLDHCHETGDLRGWLCSPCNTRLERMAPHAQHYESAQAYLLKYRQKDIAA